MVLIIKIKKPTVQQRILKAYSDLAILIALKNQAMTAYGINKYFMTKIGVTASPSMIYSNLVSMERKGWIKCVRSNNGRTYGLTEEGRKIADDMPNTLEEIKQFLQELLKN